MPDSVPANLRQFLREHVRSIAQLELLLLVRGKPETVWSAEDAAKALYIPGNFAEAILENLTTSGLVAIDEEEGRRYRYWPRTPQLSQLVDDVEKLYRERPVTTVNVMYSAPTENLQNFADAFRIRKKEEEE